MALWGLAIGVWCRQLSFEDQSSEWGTSAMRATKTRWMLENFLVRRNSSPSSHPAPAWLEPGVSLLVWGRLRGLSHSGFPSWQGTGGPAQRRLQLFSVFVTFFCIPAKGACLLCNLQPSRGSSALFQLGHAGEFTARVLKWVSRISQCPPQKKPRGSGLGTAGEQDARHVTRYVSSSLRR